MTALAQRPGGSLVARAATLESPAAQLEIVPLSPEVQELVDAQGIDMRISGLAYLPNEARVCTVPVP